MVLNKGENMTVLWDVPYGSHERHRVDIYIPDTPETREGLILIIHGGGWRQGDKSILAPDTRYRCECGFICAAMNYRFVSENVSVSDELDDITEAMKAVKTVCAQHGCNLTRVMFSGGSAGAHLSMLYAYTRANESPLTPAALFCFCPPVDCAAPDFLIGIKGEFEDWKYEVLSDCCGVKITKQNYLSAPSQKALKGISPLSYIDSDSARIPVAVCQGKLDDIVPRGQVISFINELEKRGVPCDFISYENSGHALDKDPGKAEQANTLLTDYARRFLV